MSDKPKGRPSSYNEKIADKICNALADGKSLREICKPDTMPDRATVFRWLADKRYEPFRDQYAHARTAQADALADEIVDIADESNADIVIEDGKIKVQGDVVNRSRLRVEARKWVASKLKPKSYGEKLELDGFVDHAITVEIVDFDKRSKQ